MSTEKDVVLQKVDATNLDHLASTSQIQDLYSQAQVANCAAVCVYPHHLSHLLQLQKTFASDSVPSLCTVISFPHGADTTKSKIALGLDALSAGAVELDYVVDLSSAAAGNIDSIQKQFSEINKAIKDQFSQAIIKVIIETVVYKSIDDMLRVADAVAKTGVEYVKTSTGKNGGGATPEHIFALRETLPANTKIKASGGIRNREAALAVIEAGADRIGASNLEGLK